jgi:hypothetical protein
MDNTTVGAVVVTVRLQEIRTHVRACFAQAEQSAKPKMRHMFEDVLAEKSGRLQRQVRSSTSLFVLLTSVVYMRC